MNGLGLLQCSRYAFPPNKLQYCGPLKNDEIKAYLEENVTDTGLKLIIKKFETVYPYLALISYVNNIKDPFDPRVVEAYWIGNRFLYGISEETFHDFFNESLHLKKRIGSQELTYLFDKLPKGAIAHHTFHVLNIFTRTGHHSVKHTLETMDECRIGWGKITQVEKNLITIIAPKLLLQKGKLVLGIPEIKVIHQPLWFSITEKNVGEVYSVHWSHLCEKLTNIQLKRLEHFTNVSIRLANLTI